MLSLRFFENENENFSVNEVRKKLTRIIYLLFSSKKIPSVVKQVQHFKDSLFTIFKLSLSSTERQIKDIKTLTYEKQ
jgi:hypothetical protein